jgi:hypothetical protein
MWKALNRGYNRWLWIYGRRLMRREVIYELLKIRKCPLLESRWPVFPGFFDQDEHDKKSRRTVGTYGTDRAYGNLAGHESEHSQVD